MSAQVKHGAESSPLAARLKERIAREGPISVHDYMEACLADRAAGYYLTRQPIGRDGDFITAPEISQIFGELIGAWAATVWQGMGAPVHFTIAELGPGRGTLMADALRVFDTVPKLLDGATLALVETSPVLRQLQQEKLRNAPGLLRWFERMEDVPDGPLILIANEFVDALPIRQFVRASAIWRERCIGLATDGTFGFCAGRAVETDALPAFARGVEAAEGAVVEMCPAVSKLLTDLVARAKHAPLAALIADYGHAESGFGETLQAVRAHRYADPLSAPGEADLTAHVDFAALKESAKALGLATFGPMPQGEFLLKLGLAARAERLTRNAASEKRQAILSGAARLTDPRQMGVLFKVLVLQSSGLAPPPPFGDI
ncbi:MAG TPA: SAM-dependent methyltransferase [Methyloceanibacter sp.]|nr:SAM-dependent methyltransferase [Methyloceanibacter sp.]